MVFKGAVAALVMAPFLLAPIRLQSGPDEILLDGSPGPNKASISLPSAVEITTPTVIQISPSVVDEQTPLSTPLPWPVSPVTLSPTVTPTAAPVAVVIPPQPQLMPITSAAICRSALNMLAELAILSYQQQRQQATINLTIAATMAAAHAGNRDYPNLTALTNAYRQMSFTSPNKSEINMAHANSIKACNNPTPQVMAPGSKIPVPRPN